MFPGRVGDSGCLVRSIERVCKSYEFGFCLIYNCENDSIHGIFESDFILLLDVRII